MLLYLPLVAELDNCNCCHTSWGRIAGQKEFIDYNSVHIWDTKDPNYKRRMIEIPDAECKTGKKNPDVNINQIQATRFHTETNFNLTSID